MTFNEIKTEIKNDWMCEFNVTLNDEDFEETDTGCYVRYVDYDLSQIDVYKHCLLIDDVRIEDDGRSTYLEVIGNYDYADYDMIPID